MENMHDVIIIGAGPAGLTAAYFLAKEGLDVVVFEKELKKGYLDHPCGRMFAPVKGFINVERRKEGVYYKEVEFLFPNDVISAKPTNMKFITPDGCSFGMEADISKPDFPIFQIRKGTVLKMLADRAEKAGAHLIYNTEVTGLVKEKDYIKGIFIEDRKVFAKVVISAEGLSRKFTNEAGLYDNKKVDRVVLITRFVEGVKLEENKLGEWAYLGGTRINLANSALVFHTIGKDKAMVILTVLNPPIDEEKQLIAYLNSYISKIDWIKEYVSNGKTVTYKLTSINLQNPKSLVTNGYIGIGDSIAPYGHSSNAIAMFMGKEGAKVVLNAFRKNSFSADSLKFYNKFMKSKLFKGVEFEGKLIVNLLKMNDGELNKLCECFSEINLEPFFIGTPIQQMLASLKLIVNPKMIRNRRLIKRVF
jgi:electron transfer flavoprotein-quinone oxidoreductase